MIKFKTLTITNFMSYGATPTVIDFTESGTVLLLGEDLDNTAAGTRSNGVGKTTILNALVYALYDEPLSEDIAKDALVNHTNDGKMEVKLTFEKDNVQYLIVRQRKMKAGAAGNTTTLYENGVDITLGHNVSHTNAEMVRILGVPYDLFVRIIAFSANQKPFLNLPVRHPTLPNQTDIIEELLELKILSEKAEVLKAQIKETETTMKTHLERVEVIKAEQERHNKQLKSATTRVDSWEQSHQTEIEDVQHRIEKLRGIDVEEQRRIFNAVEREKGIVTNVMGRHQAKELEIQAVTNTIEDHEHELLHLYKGECPRCHQKFQESNKRLAEIDREVSEAKGKLPILNDEHEALHKEYKDHNTELQTLKKQLVITKLEELLDTKNKIDNLNAKLNELTTAENPHNDVLNELNAVVVEQVDMTEINKLKTLLDHQTFLLKLLTKKDSFVRKALINKHIPFLNQRLKKYLVDLDFPHHVEFTPELTAQISRFGKEMGFGGLSNGQRATVNLALSFAFRDVLQSLHEFVNICMLDEVLDVGLDAVGVQAAARMLKRKARDEKIGLYIISHRDEIDSAFDRKMIVQMSGGFSSIRYEDG